MPPDVVMSQSSPHRIVVESMNSLRVVAPASTANLGPGFDCLGLALDLWNTVDVQVLEADSETEISISGEGVEELTTETDNLVYRSMEFLFNEAESEMPAVKLHCHNEVPLASGLGSSAAAIAAGLVAADALCATEFTNNDLLEMATTIEGHPDNVSASLRGGLQLVITEGQQLYPIMIDVPPEIHAVLFIPESRILTEDARAVVPKEISMADAVYNMSRVALLIAGFCTNHPEYLSIATQDRLHQPFRQALFPPMKLLFQAALDSGALGVFLSGSGPTVMALTQGREMTVAYEMAEAARQAGVDGNVKVTKPTQMGAHVVRGLC